MKYDCFSLKKSYSLNEVLNRLHSLYFTLGDLGNVFFLMSCVLFT